MSNLVTSPVPSGVRILVIDDDPRVRRAIASGMTRAGFQVLTADDGGPALELADRLPPDLAIVDYNMPTCGLEVVRRLKAIHGAAVWTTVLSGHDDEDTRSACFRAGADDVMAKPAAIPELERRMLAAARNQQAFVESRIAREQADRLLAYGAEATAMLAHDLNNGLAAALSNIAYVHQVISAGPEESEALAATVNVLRRMSGLVANFVDIARFEDAAVTPEVKSTNVRRLIEEVVGVHACVPSRGIALGIDCPESLSGRFDPALVERVLHNLINNALRYCHAGGTIEVSACHHVDKLELRVFNSGPPIAEATREKLFTKYVTGKNGRRGFGLYFCRLACEAHGGTIEYRPSDRGSAFVVQLPQRA